MNQSPDKIRAFYFDCYSLELDTRNAIDVRVSFSVGLAVLLSGIPIYYLTQAPLGTHPGLRAVFWGLIVLGGVLWVAGCAYLGAATWSQGLASYKLLGPLEDVEAYRKGFYKTAGVLSGADDPVERFDEYLIRKLAEAATENQNLNVIRARRWFRATGLLFASFAALGMAAIPFFLLGGPPPAVPQVVQVEMVMPEDNAPAPDPAPQDAPPVDNPVPEPPLRDTASEVRPDVETRDTLIERKD